MGEEIKPEFEVGEKVFISSRWNERIGTITKVKFTRGKFKYKVNETYEFTGTLRKIDSYSFEHLVKLTPEKEKAFLEEKERKELSRNLTNFSGSNGFYSLSLDQLERIHSIIKEGGKNDNN